MADKQHSSGSLERRSHDEHGGKDAAEEREHSVARRWPWLHPLAAGIFLGGAAIEMLPEALDKAGTQAWFWALGGLVLFVLIRDGLDAIGQQGLAWVATIGIWLHSFLEGAVVLEGIKKFRFVDQWGAGRFTTSGIWHPGLTAPFVDGVENVCGVLREMVWGCYALGEGLPAVGREPDFGASTNHEQHE